MNWSAYALTTYQTCKRRAALERKWRVIRWRPKSLFDSCLRQAIYTLSQGQVSAPDVAQAARERFHQMAANPGLDTLAGDPWTIATDYCAMLSTVVEALGRRTLPVFHLPEPVAIGDDVSWESHAWTDDAGQLHRWITVDAWDRDRLMREAHSWYVMGEMAIADAPITLHVVVVGQTRNGRRHSPWARTFKHPVIAGRYKFQRPDGKGGYRKLAGEEWKPVYFADLNDVDARTWVDLMDADGVTPGLLPVQAISQPSASAVRVIRDQIHKEARAAQAQEGTDWLDLAMSRGACDDMVPCPFQDACYTPQLDGAGLGDTGLYQIRKLDRVLPARVEDGPPGSGRVVEGSGNV